MKPLILLTAQAGFVALTVIYFALLVNEIRRAIPLSSIAEALKKKLVRQLITGLVLWAVFLSAWSFSGIMSNFEIFPFNVLPVLLIPLVIALFITFSKTFTEIVKHIPVERILRLQSFRFFVELILALLFIGEFLPIQMTFEGRNLDIISGVTGPIVAFLAVRGKISKTGLIIWNIACLGLLINIVTVAILSMPGPFRVFHNEPANTIVTQFPLSWLPGFLVPLAYTLHFLSLRQLFKK